MSLQCHNLGFDYGSDTILQSLSFGVEKGSLCALLGPNGSGKTTLLHCLAGILRPTTGRIELDDLNLAGLSRSEAASRIGLVPQERTEMFPFSVLEVVVMGRTPSLSLFQRPGPEDYQRAEQALGRLDAARLAGRNFNRISGGERQIAMLARAMVQSTDTLLLDEPTHYLDFKHQHRLMEVLQACCRRDNYRIVAALHDPNMAVWFADQVLMLKDGQILAHGPANTVMTPENVGRLYDTRVGQIALNGGRRLFLPVSDDTGGRLP